MPLNLVIPSQVSIFDAGLIAANNPIVLGNNGVSKIIITSPP